MATELTDPRHVGWTVPTSDANARSNGVFANYMHLCGLRCPALEAGTTKIVFEESDSEDGTYYPVYFEGARLEIDVQSSAWREQLDPAKFTGMTWVRIQLVDDSYAAVQQSTAARNFGISCREYK